MDSNIVENIVIYDWLSFTSKRHSPDEIISILGLSHVPWVESKGARGYRSRKYFSCISIHYDGRDDMGVWCEMSGQGCRTFETLSKVKWDRLFKTIKDEGFMQSAYNACVALVNAGCDISTNAPFDFGKKSKQP